MVANARALGEALKKRGYKLVTDGTDNHLLLWDLRGEGLSGAKMEKACDEAHITLNKNAVVGDVSAMNPGGVRIGGCKVAAFSLLPFEPWPCCHLSPLALLPFEPFHHSHWSLVPTALRALSLLPFGMCSRNLAYGRHMRPCDLCCG